MDGIAPGRDIRQIRVLFVAPFPPSNLGRIQRDHCEQIAEIAQTKKIAEGV